MSFWDNVKKFAQPYAEDDYDDYDDEEEDYGEEYEEEQPQPRRARRSASRGSSRRPAPAPEEEAEEPEEDDYGFSSAVAAPRMSSASAGGFSGTVLNMNSSPASSSVSNKQAVVLFHPASFNDTSKAADDLRDHKAVVVNMENVDKAMARRVVDFLSGCVYALDGNVRKIAQSVYLFCPHNMNIEGDLDTIRSEAETESYV